MGVRAGVMANGFTAACTHHHLQMILTVSNSPAIENTDMSLGQVRRGLDTNTGKTTTHGLALRENTKTEELL